MKSGRKASGAPATRRRPSAEVVTIAAADNGSEDCSQLLTKLLTQSVTGELNGLVVIGFTSPGCGPKRYRLYTTGLADSNPTLAVGAMASCQALLFEEALENAGLL